MESTEKTSNLERHAEAEMRRAGLYDKDADYGGMIPDAVISVVRAHAAQGHSGGSHATVMSILRRVLEFRALTPLTAAPAEWMEVGDGMWQSTRQPSCFSTDGGKSHYDIDEPRAEGVKPTVVASQPQ